MSREKDSLRKEFWARYEELWPGRVQKGRPPQFSDMGKAAERLRRTREYQKAQTLVVLPDPVLLQVRINALIDNKIIICATPGLKQGLVRIEPKDIPVALRKASLGGHALVNQGKHLRFPKSKTGKAGLMVIPAMAVDNKGVVLGDGRGLSDLAYALMRMTGALEGDTPVAAILAEEQKCDWLPQEPWDICADMVLTQTSLVRNEIAKQPSGLAGLPDHLAKLPVVQGIRQAARRK